MNTVIVLTIRDDLDESVEFDVNDAASNLSQKKAVN